MSEKGNNSISIIHRMVTDEYGENYWFNGCAGYVMECLGEKDYDYWFFAGLVGDLFTQHYTYTKYSGDALSCYRMDENPNWFVRDIFARCGYAADFISGQELEQKPETYRYMLTTYIDRGIPVIFWGQAEGVCIGYEEQGGTLLLISGNSDCPERITWDEAVRKTTGWAENGKGPGGWIFMGEKIKSIPLAELYYQAIADIPGHFHSGTDAYCFGAEAFRAWAADIENGKFDRMKAEEFDKWGHYTNYLCVLATNGSCCYRFLDRAKELNPDMTWLDEVAEKYRRLGQIWNDDNGGDLEAIGGGFSVTLEVLRDKGKRERIAGALRECGDCMEEVERIIRGKLC